MRRAVILGGGGIVALAAAVAVAAGSGVLSLGPDPVGATDASATPSRDTATIERRTLEITDEFEGTLGYEGSFEILGNLYGTVTMLPEPGTVLEMGYRLVELDGGGSAAVLLYGRRPAWRSLGPNSTAGLDIRQLEENLLILGLFGDLTPDLTWDDDTTEAVEALQDLADLRIDGSLDLGEIVFVSGPIRVTATLARVGAPIGPGQAILEASWPDRVVSVDLAVSDQDSLAEGTAVEIELPDGTLVPATVTAVGRVATSGQDELGGSGEPTIEVTIVPDDLAAIEGLDAAPVTIHVVAATRADVLTVPVSALLALLEGGYAVEVQEADGTSHYVGVEAGLFQDSVVEIRSDELDAGMTVVLP